MRSSFPLIFALLVLSLRSTVDAQCKQTVTYDLTGGAVPSTTAACNYRSFINSIDTGVPHSLFTFQISTIQGDLRVYTCSDNINVLINAIGLVRDRGDPAFTYQEVFCNGYYWYVVGGCNPSDDSNSCGVNAFYELEIRISYESMIPKCDCGSREKDIYMATRPLSGSLDWGGYDNGFCSPPTQSHTLILYCDTPLCTSSLLVDSTPFAILPALDSYSCYGILYFTLPVCADQDVYQSGGYYSGSAVPIGAYGIMFTGGGFSSFGLIFIVDKSPPVLTCPNGLVVVGQPSVDPFAFVSASDECSTVDSMVASPSIVKIACVDTKVIIVASDSAGNVAQCEYTLYLDVGLCTPMVGKPCHSVTMDFVGNQAPSDLAACAFTNWKTNVLSAPGTYSGFSITSSVHPQNFACNTQSAVDQLASSIANCNTDSCSFTLSCDGYQYRIVTNCLDGSDTCGRTPSGSMAIILDTSLPSTCSCGDLMTVRPLINNPNWGGYLSGCGQPSQTMTVSFYCNNCVSVEMPFVGGLVPADDVVCQYDTLINSLNPGTDEYNFIEYQSSFGPSFTCSDPLVVTDVINSFATCRGSSCYEYHICEGKYWLFQGGIVGNFGSCGRNPNTDLSFAVAPDLITPNFCIDDFWIVSRPQINHPDWGGSFNGNFPTVTCSAPSQTHTLTFCSYPPSPPLEPCTAQEFASQCYPIYASAAQEYCAQYLTIPIPQCFGTSVSIVPGSYSYYYWYWDSSTVQIYAPLGVSELTFQAELPDSSTYTCTYTIEVADYNPPQLYCNSYSTHIVDERELNLVNLGILIDENCGGYYNVTITPPHAQCNVVHTVEVRATDDYGNVGSCTMQVVLENPRICAGVIPDRGVEYYDGVPAVYYNGRYWAWASPCSGGCSTLQFDQNGYAIGQRGNNPQGWRLPTCTEAQNLPSAYLWNIDNYSTVLNCASAWFDPTWSHCDAGDGQEGNWAGCQYPTPGNCCAETLLVKDFLLYDT